MDEEMIRNFWAENNIYNKVKQLKRKKKFYFLDGPPYATGSIHIGTAWNKILKDLYIRFFRMFGYDVWDQPGYDTHGLPIENKIEKKLEIKSKNDIERLGIEKFILECKDFATKFIDVMNKQFENLGVWMDWNNPYLTLTNDYIEGAWHTFKIAYENGLLYRGLYPVHVCPRCETAVAYNEIEYTKLTDPSIYVKFPVENKENEFLVIWTTTPWTLPGNTGIMAKPDAEYVRVKVDNQILIIAKDLLEEVMKKIDCVDYKIIEIIKGKDMEGLKYRYPLDDIFQFQKNLENAHRVVLSDQFVTLDTGTGLVHTAPGHGQEDYKVGLENKLPVISPVNLNGTFNKECGEYAGIFVKSADKKIINELKNRGLLLHEETITHDYPQCWRCNTPLLQISVPQWFFKITKIRNKLIKENKKVNWYPEWAKQRFENWLENLGDWPISRQRYWGIPLPIWVCECGKIKIIGSADELGKKIKDLHRPYIDEIEFKCECGKNMKRIPDVLDVWFDSGLASWASLGYPKTKDLFNKLWPADLNIEGSDQIRGWWNSQLITSVITFDKSPFKNIVFHGLILDAHGSKMSKSLGNIVTPEEVIKKYSRDVLRFYLISYPPWNDFYFNWTEAEEVYKFFIIMENAFNFVKTYAKPAEKPKKMNIEDIWIFSRLNTLIDNCTNNFRSFNAHKAALDIKEFILNDFSRWYIKIIRDRVWPTYGGEDKNSAFYTLYEVSKNISLLLAPIAPHTAEYIHQNVLKPLGSKEESIHLCNWPKPNKKMINKELEEKMKKVRSIVETANAMRHEKKIKIRWPLKKITIYSDSDISEFENIIKFMCNVKNVEFKKSEKIEIDLDTEITEELKQEAMLREVIRKIQDMRKKNSMVISDKIILSLENCVELKKFENEIKNEVGAKEIRFEKNYGEILEFEDKKIRISIEKV